MIDYSTWKNYLLTSSPLCTLVSKQIFKEEYSIIGQILKGIMLVRVRINYYCYIVYLDIMTNEHLSNYTIQFLNV